MFDKTMRNLLRTQVHNALEEDAANQDPSAMLLSGSKACAALQCKEQAILCGQLWVNAVYELLDQERATHTSLRWHYREGQAVNDNDTVLSLEGNASTLLSGERVALNFLQFLSGIATECAEYRRLLGKRPVRLLDTRKTLPGLRSAQKYAVRIGGADNHRASLAEAFMLKENHLRAMNNDIVSATSMARTRDPNLQLIVEVENLAQLDLLLKTDADIALLDNFSLQNMREAVRMNKGKLLLEASGNIDRRNICDVADTGVDRISVGALTKNVRAIDFSLRFV